MTRVVLTGESGSITEIVEIGPTSLVRHRQWANLRPLADACASAGLAPTILSLGELPADFPAPDVWLLSDLPFLAAEAFGILDRLTADVPTRSGLLMIGGAFSFSGLKGIAGWGDPRGAALLPVEPIAGADDTEKPAGLRVVPTDRCPAGLATVLADAPPFFGYNRIRPRDDAEVLAHFEDGQPALIATGLGPRRSVAFASDLLPHWAPEIAGWERFAELVGGLCALAAPGGL